MLHLVIRVASKTQQVAQIWQVLLRVLEHLRGCHRNLLLQLGAPLLTQLELLVVTHSPVLTTLQGDKYSIICDTSSTRELQTFSQDSDARPDHLEIA